MTQSRPTYRILVADDERSVLEAYRTVLTGLNPERDGDVIESLEAELFGESAPADEMPVFEPVICRGGEEAVEAVRAAKQSGDTFPVAFLDVRMPPGIDGVEAAGKIRALDPDINIVIVTAHADSHPREIARRVPPLDKLFYINKPFQATEVQQFVLALSARWSAERKLRSVNTELTLRCLELEATHAQLRAAREQAEFASRSKSEFLANMSHELRTPLNAILGFTDVMRAGSYGPIENERYQHYLEDISRSGTHLLQVIGDLLDFSKIEAGKLEIRREEIDVGDLVDNVMGMLRHEAEHSGVTLQRDHWDADARINADPHRLRQILLNLLSNAIKFTPPPGDVRVSIALDPAGALSIAVADTGIGMTEADVECALEPFRQVDQGLARKYQGTGLGLPLAKRLAELQGATLEVSSRIREGTAVTVTFPKAFSAPDLPDPAVTAVHDGVEERARLP